MKFLTEDEINSAFDDSDGTFLSAGRNLEILIVRKIFTNGNRELSMKDRFFRVFKDGFISDENFDFDAGMKVTGDFYSEDERFQYACMIADALNNYNKGE